MVSNQSVAAVRPARDLEGQQRPEAAGSDRQLRATDFALQTSGCAANSASRALQVLDSSRLESAGAAATTWPGQVLTDFALISAATRINGMAPFLSTEFDLQNTVIRGAGMFPGTEAICPAILRRGAHQSMENVDLPRCSWSGIQGTRQFGT